MRLVDADAFKRELYQMGCIDKFGQVATSINRLNIALERSKADPVVHGHWVEQEHCDWVYSKEYRCSECGQYRLMTNPVGREWNYCPHCGAKMDEVKDDNA